VLAVGPANGRQMGAVGTFADILLFKKVVNFITVVSHDCIISEGFGFTREGLDNI
ncbi:hypothetical protein HMPREF0201_04898, partial [Cedecea davisae DSM 4568]